MKNSKGTFITHAAAIAAIYVVLTLVFAPISYGEVQVRIAEALTILPFFTPAAIPGLFIGCLIGNFLGGAILPDIIFGSLATLIGAIGSYALRKHKFAVPLQMLTVGIGEVLSCGVIGMILLLALEKYRNKIPGFNTFS